MRRPPFSAGRWCPGRDRRRPGRAMRRRRCDAPRHPPVSRDTRAAVVDGRDAGAVARSGQPRRRPVQRQPRRAAGGGPHRAAGPADGGDRGRAAPAAAGAAMPASAEYLQVLRRCGVAAVLSGAGPAVIGSEHCGRNYRPRSWNSAPPMDSPSARCRSATVFGGRRRDPFGVDTVSHTRISVFLASSTEAGYSRSRPAIAASLPAPTLGRHTNSSRG